MQKDYGDLNIFNAIPLLIALIICIPYTLFFNKKDRRIAEQNIHSLTGPWHRDVYEDKNISSEMREQLRLKWDIIDDGIDLDKKKEYYKNSSAIARKFFKRNNIDLYSEDFDPEYVAKCIREQEIC